jgi:hypothetical protein
MGAFGLEGFEAPECKQKRKSARSISIFYIVRFTSITLGSLQGKSVTKATPSLGVSLYKPRPFEYRLCAKIFVNNFSLEFSRPT